MKRVALLVGLLGSIMPATAGLISGVSVTASSEFTQSGWDLRAIHLVDGSGLSSGDHGSCLENGTCWQNNVTGFPNVLDFDLGINTTLAGIHVWNGYWSGGESARSAYQVNISVSSDGSNWTPEGLYQFLEAPTSVVSNYSGFDVFSSPVAWSNVRWVRLEILNNFGGGSCGACVTVGEVQFSSADTITPEASSIQLGLLGLICLLFRPVVRSFVRAGLR